MKRHHHRIIAYVLIAAAIAVFAILKIKRHYVVTLDQQSAKIDTRIPLQTAPSSTSTPPAPKSFLLKVPFTPQAPTGNWDQLHGEACEEASSIMAAAYFGAMQNGSHQTDITLPPALVEDQLTKLTQWEQDHFGYYLDINSEETAQMVENVYGLKTKILSDYTQNTIKDELLQNHVVLLPANGVKLGNPNFRSPGPPYHMLVLRGYTSTAIITNDPGTRNGLDYSYSFNTLYNANGDFDHSSHSVDLKNKNIIVVWK